jgi:acyl-lipid omega-6 desaturase (Delta-12 desaturase)
MSTTRPTHHQSLSLKLREYQKPILHKSLFQIATSFGGFVATCAVMFLCLDVSYWISLCLAPVAAGFLVRIFIIQHDCGHGSFFRSQLANDVVGSLSSLLTLAPYASWRRQHAGHHRVWNDLDRRDRGLDIYSSCLTVDEFRSLRPGQRLWYRFTRHPLVANVLLPPFIFIVLFRLPFDTPKAWAGERRGVYLTDVLLVAGIVGLGFLVGFWPLLAIHLPIMVAASIIGVWLFSVQHRFEDVEWKRSNEWNYTEAALEGSSYLRLHSVLRWFTGNIGYHHVHHLNPRIPNYNLKACHERIVRHCHVPEVNLWQSFQALRLVLWDEAQNRMVTFGEA